MKIKKKIANPNLKKLIKNSGVLLSGNIIADIMGLISFIFLARGLEKEIFGLFTIILTYVTIMDSLINFQSWQALIKYGTECIIEQKENAFKKLIKAGFIIDFLTATLSFILAIGLLPFIYNWLGLSDEMFTIGLMMAGIIVFHIKGPPIAILRIFDKFNILALLKIISASIKLTGVITVYLMNADLFLFALVWVITDIVESLLLVIFGVREMKKQGYAGFFKPKISKKEIEDEFKGLFGFIITTNLHSSIKLGVKQFDIMIVGAILSPSAAGVFKITKQFSGIILKLSDPFYQVIYPDLNKLWIKKEIKSFVQLIKQSVYLAFAGSLLIWLSFLLLGTYIISFTVGDEYISAYQLISVYMIGVVIATSGFPLQPSMLAMGKYKESFWIHNFSIIVYLSLLFLLIEYLGLLGAVISFVCYYFTWTLIMIIFQYNYIKRKL